MKVYKKVCGTCKLYEMCKDRKLPYYGPCEKFKYFKKYLNF